MGDDVSTRLHCRCVHRHCHHVRTPTRGNTLTKGSNGGTIEMADLVPCTFCDHLCAWERVSSYGMSYNICWECAELEKDHDSAAIRIALQRKEPVSSAGKFR